MADGSDYYAQYSKVYCVGCKVCVALKLMR